jgi:hypothetical protein
MPTIGAIDLDRIAIYQLRYNHAVRLLFFSSNL